MLSWLIFDKYPRLCLLCALKFGDLYLHGLCRDCVFMSINKCVLNQHSPFFFFFSSLTKTAKKRSMSSKEGSPVVPQSPRNSSLYLWSSARIKLSAARLRSHKLLTQKNRPLSYLSRLSCGDSSSKSHPPISEPMLKESLASVTAPAAGS